MAITYEDSLLGQHESTFTFADGEQSKVREIFLPLSVSENRRQIIKNGRVLINTPEYNRYLTDCVRLIRKGSLPMFTENIVLINCVFFPDRRVRDPQNYEKALFDVFSFSRFDRSIKSTVWAEKPLSERSKGFLYNDDSQVSMHLTYRVLIKGYAFHYLIAAPMTEAPTLLTHAKEILCHANMVEVAKSFTRYNTAFVSNEGEL